MSALVALVALGFENHFFVANGADHTGPGAHVAALQAVVEQAVLVDIKKNVTAAAGTTFCFPFRHLCYSIFQARSDVSSAHGLATNKYYKKIDKRPGKRAWKFHKKGIVAECSRFVKDDFEGAADGAPGANSFA
jgi:hypothetical protein